MAKPVKNRSRRSQGSGLTYKIIGTGKKVFFRSLPYLFTLLIIGVLFGGAIAWAVNLPVFGLDEVRILNIGSLTEEQAFNFCELRKGENLMHLDLPGVQQVIKRKHPEFKEVRVRRVLPNRVEVMLKRRTPVAQVAFSRFVQIDKDMVILPGSSTTAFRNLLVIEGASSPRQGVFVGAQLDDPKAMKALTLASLVKRQNVLKKHLLTKVSVVDPKNITLFVDDAIEIRVGDSHFLDRMKILGETLKMVDLDPTRIRYIDLRFDDVVIGPR